LGIITLAAYERVKRIPIGRAEGRQGITRCRTLLLPSRGQDNAPVRGMERHRGSAVFRRWGHSRSSNGRGAVRQFRFVGSARLGRISFFSSFFIG
jgi:hypothetical protein